TPGNTRRQHPLDRGACIAEGTLWMALVIAGDAVQFRITQIQIDHFLPEMLEEFLSRCHALDRSYSEDVLTSEALQDCQPENWAAGPPSTRCITFGAAFRPSAIESHTIQRLAGLSRDGYSLRERASTRPRRVISRNHRLLGSDLPLTPEADVG